MGWDKSGVAPYTAADEFPASEAPATPGMYAMPTAESTSNPYSIAAAALAGASSLPWSARVLGERSLFLN